MRAYYLFVVAMIFCFTSCEDNSTSAGLNDNTNSPVTTNVTNSFTYSVNAIQYSDSSYNDLVFSSDSLVVTLATSNYSSGQAVILVSDSLNATIFSDTVKSNKTIVIAHLYTTKPRHCILDITNLTAKFAFVVVGQ